MSVRQNTLPNVRYMKRNNLHEEAKIIGNYYRDVINSFGVDCIYQKLDTSVFENYNGLVDRNTILEHAYGINLNPDYSCSATMITFPEVEQDIFQLQKYGLNPNTDITFYFDSTDFACALAEKCGQYQEFKITETSITCEVPDCTDDIEIHVNPFSGETISTYMSADHFPYALGLGYAENYHCQLMDGKLSVEIEGYEYGKEQTVMCDPYQHTDFKLKFPSNDDLSKSIQHRLQNSEYLKTLLFLTFTVNKTKVGIENGQPIYKSILHGTLHGGVLFYSLNKVGKYLEKIHPEVGDLITIDFPDETNPEKYEITDCFDKQLTQDGISPLLHNYIWKCKARRYVNNYDNVDMNLADKQLKEKQDFTNIVEEDIAKSISDYPQNEDSVYGGYEKEKNWYDAMTPDPVHAQKFDFLDDGTSLDLIRFSCGSRIVTTGYELLFIDINGQSYKVTTMDKPLLVKDIVFEEGLRWIKASDSMLVFVNFEGEVFKIVEDTLATQEKMQMCLNSLFEKTLDPNNTNKKLSNFYIFKESRTLLWATQTNLYCRLSSDGKVYQIV